MISHALHSQHPTKSCGPMSHSETRHHFSKKGATMSEYDALRKAINHEANQEYDGGFFARLYGFDPDSSDECLTARDLFQFMARGEESK